jgi:hypothetical protein
VHEVPDGDVAEVDDPDLDQRELDDLVGLPEVPDVMLRHR